MFEILLLKVLIVPLDIYIYKIIVRTMKQYHRAQRDF